MFGATKNGGVILNQFLRTYERR